MTTADVRANRRPGLVRPLTILAIAALVAAACGQKPNVSQVAAGSGGSGGDDLGSGVESGFSDLEGGDASSDSGTDSAASGGAGGGAAAGGTGGSAGGGGAAGGGGGGGAAAGGGGGGGGGAEGDVGDRPGVSGKEIRIGIHAPVTGAAPVPSDTFRDANDTYWAYVTDTAGGVFGDHSVKVFFEDDEFNPQKAVQVCRKMVEENDVFLLIGAAGADQITACAKYAESVGVPYLSAGVNQTEVDRLRGYFAVSMSYKQQSPILAQLAKKNLGTQKIAIAVADTPSFADARDSMIAESKAQGLQVVYQKAIPKKVDATNAPTVAGDICDSDADTVYILTSPTGFIAIAAAAAGQNCNPQFIGPGISGGLNTVALAGCPSIGEARFLSPFMQLDKVDENDPNWRAQSAKMGRDTNDDLALALWGINQAVHRMFDTAGRNMTRATFVQALESGQQYNAASPRIFGPFQFGAGAGNHFGSKAAHLLKAVCAGNNSRYITEALFVSGF